MKPERSVRDLVASGRGLDDALTPTRRTLSRAAPQPTTRFQGGATLVLVARCEEATRVASGNTASDHCRCCPGDETDEGSTCRASRQVDGHARLPRGKLALRCWQCGPHLPNIRMRQPQDCLRRCDCSGLAARPPNTSSDRTSRCAAYVRRPRAGSKLASPQLEAACTS